MEEFGLLPWRISEPSILDTGTDFIKEENISKTLVFKNDFKPYEFPSDSNDEEPSYFKPKIKLPRYPHTSRLNKNQQLICLDALKLLENDPNVVSAADQLKINTYNNLKFHIKEENILFLKYVEKEWTRMLFNRSKKMLKRMEILGTKLWKNQLQIVKNYKQYYKILNMLPLSPAEHPTEILYEGPVLEMGNVAKLIPPNLESNSKCNLNLIPSINGLLQSNNEVLKYTKYPISQDIYAEKLAKTYNCNIVVTSSGLKTIIDNYGPDFQQCWDLPLVVKEYEINGKKTKIIFIDKPLGQKNISYIDLNLKCRKILLKTNLCKEIAHSFPVPNVPETSEIKTVLIEKPAKKMRLNPKLTPNSAENKSLEAGEISQDSSDPETITEFTTKRNRPVNIKIHHNVSYRIWKLKLKPEKKNNLLLKGCTEGKELKILVRSKTDGLQTAPNGALVPVSLVPKLEFQWEFGAEQLSKSEIIRQWASIFFRPYSQILRVRMNATNQEYIKTETINLNKITTEGLKHNVSATTNLGVLYNVISNLIDLNVGDYLLHHTTKHGSFAALMQNLPNSTPDTLDLHEFYKEQNCKIENDIKWRPLEPNVVLPIHSIHGIMPGMFPPHKTFKKTETTFNNKGTGKGKKKKKKMKSKKAKNKNMT